MMVNLKGIYAVSLLVISHVFSTWSFAAPPAGNDSHAAHAAFAKGHYHKAAVHYQQLLRNDSDNPGYRMKLAESYELSGKLELAEEHATKVLGGNRKNTEALLLMGRIRGRHEDWAGSKAYYDQAVKADKNDASAYLGLGQALMQLGEDDSAESAFTEYRRLTDVPAP
jgi:tetratricopeptide (TPR) repeat protein